MFTTQQQEFASAVEQFCEKHCATAQQRDALTDGGRLSNSPEMLRKFADLGWLGVSLPVEYGGCGAGGAGGGVFLGEAPPGVGPAPADGTRFAPPRAPPRPWGREAEEERTPPRCHGGLQRVSP